MRYVKRIFGCVLLLLLLLLITGVSLAVHQLVLRNVTLTVLYPESEGTVIQPLLDKYSTQNEHVEITAVPYTGTLTEEVCKESKADLVFLKDQSNKEISDWEKTFQPLDAFFKERADSMLLRQPEESPQYGIPLSGEIPVILYSKELFSEIGLPCPENINDFVDVCAILASQEVPPLAVRVDSKGDWDIKGLADSIFVNSVNEFPAAEGGDAQNLMLYDLAVLADQIRDNLLLLENRDADEWMQGLLDKKYAMVLATSTDAAEIQDTADLGGFILYGQATCNYAAWHTGMSAAIPRKSHYEDAAKELLEYLLLPESQTYINQCTQMLPAVRNASVLLGQEALYRVISNPDTAVLSYFDGLTGDEYTACLRAIQELFQAYGLELEEWSRTWPLQNDNT